MRKIALPLLSALVIFLAWSGCSSDNPGTSDPDGEPSMADADAGVDGDEGTGDDGGIDDADNVDAGADSDSTDDDPLPCNDNSDCADDWFCIKTLGNCSTEGTCQEMPTACPELPLPVCACDFTTYTNSCAAHAAGVSVLFIDHCEALRSCQYDQECPEGMFCRKEHGCTDAGTCAEPPSGCSKEWDPVCGCDLVEYANACLAHATSTNVTHPGSCSIANACISAADCEPDFFCQQDGTCDGIGDCTSITAAGSCGAPGPLDHPVCGCDGQTYQSYCLAREAGVSIWNLNQICEGFTRPCQANSDCNADEYCGRELGTCDGSGFCRAVPDNCAEMQLYDPVCGCDGNSYSSICMAHQDAINVVAIGPCPISGCLLDAECEESEYCHTVEGQCGGRGQCEAVLTTDCPAEQVPVCGCDGKTYWNDCTAAAAGVSLAASGACDPSTQCSHNDDCPAEHYCSWDLPTCQAVGHCEALVDFSTCQEITPELVCGCDGNLYENICETTAMGVNIAYPGECAETCMNNDDCAEQTYCARELGLCAGPGQCLEKPFTCPTEDVPVCGCNGQTFPNACFAQATGQGIVAEGTCTGTCAGNQDCAQDEYCQKSPGECSSTGFCSALPLGCPDVDAPVCGCDGSSYGNDCEANMAGVNVAQSGACPQSCTNHSDCSEANTYCAKEIANCDGPGQCQPQPNEGECENNLWEPVCGCDGITYANACVARARGANVAQAGKCDLTGACLYLSECQPGSFCKKESNCRQIGTCTTIPSECPAASPEDAVCSCDLQTYASACHAWMNSQNVTYPSTCAITDVCYSSADCAADEFCQLINCEELGTCWPRWTTQDCEGWSTSTLCACNGVSYDNACWAAREGYSVLYQQGSCEDLATVCTTNNDCALTEYCFWATGDCAGQGVCHPRPSYCAQEYWQPVCGCDGQSYASYCDAHFVGVNVATLTSCPE